jgi:hypothetical protein
VIANLTALSQTAAVLKKFNSVAPIGPFNNRNSARPNPTKWDLPSPQAVTVTDLAPDESLEFRLAQANNKLKVTPQFFMISEISHSY